MNLSLSRAFTSNLGAIVIKPAEQTALAAEGIAEPTIQRYVLWRRATMLMVVIFTALSAAVSTYTTFMEEDQPDIIESVSAIAVDKLETIFPPGAKILRAIQSSRENAAPADEKAEKPEKPEKAEPADKKAQSAASEKSDAEEKTANENGNATDTGEDEEGKEIKAMGRLADNLRLLALYALPIAALISLFLRNRFQLSFRIMVIAFAFSFFAPMLMALCPWSWWGVVEPKTPGGNPLLFIKDQAEGVAEGAALLVGLLPSVLSLIPGVQRACLRVKTLFPQALLPGWLIVVASPLYGLFLLVVVVAVDQFVSELAILIPLALLAAASLTFAVRADAFTRPLLCDADFRRQRSVQRVVSIFTLLAGVILVTFLCTRDILGVHLVGTIAKSSLVRPMDVVELIMETLGRSMFVSALGAEFVIRMSLTAWRHNRAVIASDTATAYDSGMAAVGEALAPVGERVSG